MLFEVPFDLLRGIYSDIVWKWNKEKLNLKVLCVTINPPLRSNLGYENLEIFKKNNVDLIEVNLPYEPHRKLNTYGLIHNARPLYGWLISIITAVSRVANNFNIDFI